MTHAAPALRLRAVTEADEAVVRAAHEAMAGEYTFAIGFDPSRPWSDHVAALERYRQGEDLPARWVASTFLLAEVDGVVVGRASIRHELGNDFLATEGGHIGYAIVPEHRGRGYARPLLRQALLEARRVGVDRALVCCDDDNLPSVATIEGSGGVYDGTVTGESGQPVRRYWLDTDVGSAGA